MNPYPYITIPTCTCYKRVSDKIFKPLTEEEKECIAIGDHNGSCKFAYGMIKILNKMLEI